MLLLVPIAIISGVLTVFSPCVLPILPIILTSGVDGNKRRERGIIVGLVLSFTLVALFLSTLVTTFNISPDVLRTLAAFLLLLIGVSILFPIWDKLSIYIERLVNKPISSKGTGFKSGLLTGIGLGIAWTPCVGPIVATVSTIVALNGIDLRSIVLVLSYAIGLGIPLWLIAEKGSELTAKLGLFRKNPKLVRQIFGVVLIATALFIYGGYEKQVQKWFLDNLPENWTNIASNFEQRLNIESKLKGVEMDSKEERFYKVDPKEIVQGCLGGMDCIPSIDNPIFQTGTEAETWLNPDDLIFGVNHNGIQRAYPQKIMNWHEIVNDMFGQDPVAVTFCPLCGTGASFIRKVNGKVVEFGVSGKLHNSDLIMYDRTSETNYWQQATGEAIVGPAAKRGEELEWVATTTTTWEKWHEKYPNTEVLSTETGHSRNYDLYPYFDYEESSKLLFGVTNEDERFHRKAVTYGIKLADGTSKAYLLDKLQEEILVDGQLEDTVGATNITVSRSAAEEYTFTNTQTGEEIIPLRGFWFAWIAFNPDTEVF